MTWKDSLKIGIPEIDRQHEGICRMADEFYNACVQGKGSDEVARLLDYLAAYTLEHFAAEEKLQKEIGYPHFDKHKAQHDDMRSRVSELKKELVQWHAATPLVKAVNETVTAWLIRHIMGFDMDLKKYMLEVK